MLKEDEINKNLELIKILLYTLNKPGIDHIDRTA
jgi:hypothetical protein